MDDWDIGWEAAGYDSGPALLEFVDPPAFNGENVEWSFRTKGGGTAPAGTITSVIAMTTRDGFMKHGGTNKLRTELGPHDVGGARVNPAQYTREDGDYHLNVTVGGEEKGVWYRMQDGHAQSL